MTISSLHKPAAWLGGYAFEATLPRASGNPIDVEATISPEGRLLDFGVTGSAVAAEDLGLLLIDFFCAEFAAKGVDGPHVVDLIAALPENSPAALVLAAIWDQHPEGQPEPKIAQGFAAPAAAPQPDAAKPSEAALDAMFGEIKTRWDALMAAISAAEGGVGTVMVGLGDGLDPHRRAIWAESGGGPVTRALKARFSLKEAFREA